MFCGQNFSGIFKHHEHEKKKNGAEANEKAFAKEPQKFIKNGTMANWVIDFQVKETPNANHKMVHAENV